MAAQRVLTLAFSVLAVVLLGAGPAVAASQETVLTVTTAEGEAGTPPGKVATLTCEPTGGTHQNRAHACRELTAVQGNAAQLDVNPDQACTMEYFPITVTLKGTWQGREVAFSSTYGNGCVLHGKTGPVFDI
ncbi:MULTISPECIES: SSI family serine proteinase inhibitor [unclassified Crossiella]|uniref:SSI family serine proteinase inhibitor n=1 Tax=unclassified Crossiella TaxID=2620835 RepID=UPI001FFEE054|nr:MULTISPECIES: SSI family serine proteinase inhibitor [unclassified Crossiella]MCK2237956.1 subtilase-type protease inhibitor [Crossiella sp. S99.2]MCK2255239.1 subtilase-type protease inhibitor [Crossiella sp. S99.1]